MEKNNKPIVSLLMPIYGVANYIERCAVSALEQTYDNIEYVFVNDCTPDSSMEILQKVLERYPSRKNQVRIINHEKNRGLAAARNTAVANTTGEFIMHLDSDDWIETNTVELCVQEQMKGNYDIVSFDALTHSVDGKNRLRPCPNFTDTLEMSYKLLYCGLHNVWGRLIRRSLYVNNGLKCLEGYNQAEDLQIMPLLAFYAKSETVLHLPLYHYNLTNENSYSNINYRKQRHVLNQANTARKMLRDFFTSKGEKYQKHVDALEITICLNVIKLTSDEKEFYEAVKNLHKKNLSQFREIETDRLRKLIFRINCPWLLWIIMKWYRYL